MHACFLSAQVGSLRDPTLHELDCQGGVYKNTRLEAASCFLGVLPLFSFRGPPPISNFGVHGDFHYYRYFLRLLGLLFIGPCMAMFYVISKPSGTYRGTPSPFLELQLALKLETPEALVSLYYPLSLIPVPARVRNAPLGAGRGLLAVTKLGQIGPW